MKRKRCSYEAGFKLRVIEFAKINGNSNAAREYNINEKQVREWKKNEKTLDEIPKTKCARRGHFPSFIDLETELNQWVLEQRQNGYIDTRGSIRFRALQLKKSDKYKNKPEILTFVASSGWCSRFMNRNSLTLRQRTKIAQKLPAVLEEKVLSFHSFVIYLRKKCGYDLSQIGNMDETPMTFDLPGNQTVDTVGAKTIMIKTTGHERTHFTVVLSCMADGTKLQPVIIFKRKTLPKGAKFPTGVIVQAHPKGWMDEQGTQSWMNNVWNKRPGAMLNKRSLLVWDMFRAHLTDNCKKTAVNLKTDLAVIPGGLTSILQPLDVCLNKPFKDRLRKMWSHWMSSGSATLTKSGNLQKPDITLVAAWVDEAWKSIPEDMIQHAFRKCGISNAMDGSEDDALFVEEDDDPTDVEVESEDDDHTEDNEELVSEDFYNELFDN